MFETRDSTLYFYYSWKKVIVGILTLSSCLFPILFCIFKHSFNSHFSEKGINFKDIFLFAFVRARRPIASIERNGDAILFSTVLHSIRNEREFAQFSRADFRTIFAILKNFSTFSICRKRIPTICANKG